MNECAENRLALAASLKECSNVILALGDETRQQIIITLLENEQVGLRVGEIASRTHLSRPAVSHHLKILKEAKIIAMYRKGTMNFYYINADDTAWLALKNLSEQIYALAQNANNAGYLKNEADNI